MSIVSVGHIILAVWAVVAFALLGRVAYEHGRDGPSEYEALPWAASVFWPFALALLLAYLPFRGLYLLGKRHAEREDDPA